VYLNTIKIQFGTEARPFAFVVECVMLLTVTTKIPGIRITDIASRDPFILYKLPVYEITKKRNEEIAHLVL
jgi:hypothetical protein